jgi:hypothetical protein
MKGSVAKIAAYLKNDISEYFKEKGLWYFVKNTHPAPLPHLQLY